MCAYVCNATGNWRSAQLTQRQIKIVWILDIRCKFTFAWSHYEKNSFLIAWLFLIIFFCWLADQWSRSRISDVQNKSPKLIVYVSFSTPLIKDWLSYLWHCPTRYVYHIRFDWLIGEHCVRACVVRFYATFNYERFWLIWLWPSNLNGSLKKQLITYSQFMLIIKEEEKTNWTMKMIWIFLGFFKGM